jgi:sigma-B regulation protein RsbU (phosphoserine phosphatase)
MTRQTIEDLNINTGKVNLLQYREGGNRSSERIEKLVSSRWFVLEDDLVLDVSEALKDEKIHIVGVVDYQGKVKGLVLRQNIMNLLSRQFGREVLKTEIVKTITTTCRYFDADVNIFAVADSIVHEMQANEITYFLVRDSEQKFVGIFSTNDMLLYLSSMTRHDIELARILQKGIVKEYKHHRDQSFEIVCSSIMAQIVGGDFYTLQKISDNKFFIVLCDVSGKGVAASLVTAFLYGMTHNYRFYDDLEQFVKALNRMFMNTFNLEKFVTGQFIDFDQSNGELRICEMGHPFAYLFRNAKISAIEEESFNMPIGVIPEVDPKVFIFNMQPGDMVLIITDGLSEQTDSDDNVFPFEDIATEIEKYKDFSLDRISVRILEYFHGFRKKTPLQDDVTFLLLRYNGNESA